MSGLNLLSTNKNSAAFRPGFAPSSTLDVAAAAFENVRENYNFDSEMRLIGDPLNSRNSLIKERFGQTVSDITGTSKKYTNPTAEGRLSQLKEDNDLIDNIIMKGRKEEPSRWENIKTTAEIRDEGKKKANDAMTNLGQVSSRNPSQLSNATGQLLGGIGGTFTDPLTVATLPFGAGETKIVGTGAMATAKGFAASAAKEGAIQAAIQALSIPQVAHWQNTVGHQYGLSEAATDVGLGFVGGAAIRGATDTFIPAVRGVYKGANHVSAYALDTIAARAPNLPQTVKDSLKYMSRTAYVDDAAPIEIKSAGELKAHREIAQKVVDDVNQYKRPLAGADNSEAVSKLKESPEFKTAVEDAVSKLDVKPADKFFDQKALDLARNQNDQSRERLIYMNPKDFLDVAMAGFDKSKSKRVSDMVKNNEKFSDVPFLSFTHDGEGTAKVTGHEGRHRARALMDMGITEMPVVVKHVYDANGQAMRWGSLAKDFKDEYPRKLYAEHGDTESTRMNKGKSIDFPVPDPRKPVQKNAPEIKSEVVEGSFDDNAYRLREYRETPIVPPSEIKPSERLAANQARFDTLVKENPDMMITSEDGTVLRLSDYAGRMKEDQKIVEALTTCMVA